MRRSLVWMVALPLTIGGCLAAHALAYRLVASHAHERSRLLALTGHGYLGYAPLVLGVLAGILAVALAGIVVGAARGSSRPRLSAPSFFTLPLVGFAVQEHAERFVHSGHLSAAIVLEPAVLVGIGLQVPIAFVVFLVARALLAVAEVAGRALAVGIDARRPVSASRRVRPGVTDLVRIPVLALGYPGRGPPGSLLS